MIMIGIPKEIIEYTLFHIEMHFSFKLKKNPFSGFLTSRKNLKIFIGNYFM